MNNKPKSIGVVITTYNSPDWLALVLSGYEAQCDSDFRVLIADDGSSQETTDVIERFCQRGKLVIDHFWHPDNGFQKTKILNKAIAETSCDYLIFTDGDCVPRNDFVSVHRHYARRGCFLSGGYLKLSMAVSRQVTEENIADQSLFRRCTLVKFGQQKSVKLLKLIQHAWLRRLLNRLTPTKATWNGMNSSGWKDDLEAVNGFDERMQYGGLDRELGERLWNYGLTSRQIRYSAICLHLDHPRGYSTPETWKKNRKIRHRVVADRLKWTDFGIARRQPPGSTG